MSVQQETNEHKSGLSDMGLSPEEQAEFDQMVSDEGETVDSEVIKEGDGAADKHPVRETVAEDDEETDDEPVLPASNDKPISDKQKTINYEKHRRLIAKEKAEREKYSTELQTERVTSAKLAERLNLVLEAINNSSRPQQPEAPIVPDEDEDPIAAIKWLKQQNKALGDQLNGTAQQFTAARDETTLRTTYESDAKRFAQTEPEFGNGYTYLMQMRMAQHAFNNFGKDITQDGVQLTPQEVASINREIASEEQAVVQQAMRRGESPAAYVYKLATLSGFRPQPKQAAALEKSAARAAPATNERPRVSDSIRNIKQGRDASLSLSDASGSAGNTELTVEHLAGLSDKEFGKMMENIDPDKLQELLGRMN